MSAQFSTGSSCIKVSEFLEIRRPITLDYLHAYVYRGRMYTFVYAITIHGICVTTVAHETN